MICIEVFALTKHTVHFLPVQLQKNYDSSTNHILLTSKIDAELTQIVPLK